MIKRILLWLISIYFKPATTETKTPEVETMSEPLVDTVVEQPVVENVAADVQPVVESAAEVAAEPEATETDAVLAKLKELVAAAGAQSHAVFDDLIELAKKLI